MNSGAVSFLQRNGFDFGKQMKYGIPYLSVQEEFTGKSLPPDLEDSLPKTLPDLFDTVRSGIRRSAEAYINICNMMERLSKRNEGMAAEYSRFASALQVLTESSKDTYAVDTRLFLDKHI